MTKKKDNEMFEKWASLSGQIAGNIARMWGQKSSVDLDSDDLKARLNRSCKFYFELWEIFLGSIKNFEAFYITEKDFEKRKTFFEKIINLTAENFQELQKKNFEHAETIKKNWENMDPGKIDKEMIKRLGEIYHNEFSKIYGIPQVGLFRKYQKNIAESLDKFNLFNASLIEFLYFLYLPMEKTFLKMEKDFEKLFNEGNLPQNYEEFYRLWIKKLESHYMSMFRSKEYISVLAKTFEKMAEFKMAREAVLEDIMHSIPVTTKSEIYEIYKEFADLKRTVKKMEKNNSK